jgi:type II secretory pathway pseudopilin PulG
LLEVVVAIALIAMASSVVGFKMHGAIAEKRFTSELDKLRAHLLASSKLSVATQDDWQAVLEKQGAGWVFSACSEEGRRLSPLKLSPIEISLNGKKMDRIRFQFFSTGKILPEGTLVFSQGDFQVEWKYFLP